MVIETFDLEAVFRVSVFIDRPQILVTGVFMHGEFKNHGTVMPKQKLPILRGIATYALSIPGYSPLHADNRHGVE